MDGKKTKRDKKKSKMEIKLFRKKIIRRRNVRVLQWSVKVRGRTRFLGSCAKTKNFSHDIIFRADKDRKSRQKNFDRRKVKKVADLEFPVENAQRKRSKVRYTAGGGGRCVLIKGSKIYVQYFLRLLFFSGDPPALSARAQNIRWWIREICRMYAGDRAEPRSSEIVPALRELCRGPVQSSVREEVRGKDREPLWDRRGKGSVQSFFWRFPHTPAVNV